MFSFFRVSRLLVACILIAFFGSAEAQVVLNFDASNTILLGATGVNVNNVLYNVSFETGSCDGLYGGCASSAFTFKDIDASFAASDALMNQVFIDIPQHSLNSSPALTAGCTAITVSQCSVYTPFNSYKFLGGETVFDATYFDNFADSNYDAVYSSQALVAGDPTTFAIWTPEPLSVPEPGTLALLGLGMVGLGLYRRRHKVISNV